MRLTKALKHLISFEEPNIINARPLFAFRRKQEYFAKAYKKGSWDNDTVA